MYFLHIPGAHSRFSRNSARNIGRVPTQIEDIACALLVVAPLPDYELQHGLLASDPRTSFRCPLLVCLLLTSVDTNHRAP
jgi:hypothetical protein